MILNGNLKLIPKIIDNEDIKEIYEMIGMFILLALMVFIFGNDIFQTWFSK